MTGKYLLEIVLTLRTFYIANIIGSYENRKMTNCKHCKPEINLSLVAYSDKGILNATIKELDGTFTGEKRIIYQMTLSL